MSVIPRLARPARKAGSALICSVLATHSSIMIGGCTPGTVVALTTPAPWPVSRQTVTIQVARCGLW